MSVIFTETRPVLDRFQDCWKDWSRNRVYSNKKFVLAYQVKAVLSRQIDICVDSDIKKDAFGFATFGLAVLVVTISKQVLARAVGRQALVGHVPRAAELRLRLLQCQNFQEYILGESEIKKAGFVQIKSVLRIAYSNKKKDTVETPKSGLVRAQQSWAHVSQIQMSEIRIFS